MTKFMGDVNETVNLYLSDNLNMTVGEILRVDSFTTMLDIKKFTVNGQDKNYLHLESKENEIRFNVDGVAKQPMKFAVEARLFDSNNILLGVFSPCHVQGMAPEVNGEFSYDSTLKLPKNMTKGTYILQVDMSYPNVEFLAKVTSPIVVEADGLVGKSGINFEYNGSGFLML